MYNHWFVSRQKRQLTTLLPALIAFNDKCVGKVWPGNRNLQLEFEDMLQKLDRERQSTGMVANLQFCHDLPEIIKHFRRTKS